MASPRAAELATAADARLAELLARTDAAPDAALGDAWHQRRVADILGHLHAWHLIFDGWIAQERAGSEPAYPAEGYTWDALTALNDVLYQAHRERSYDALRAMVVSSHSLTVDLLAGFSDEELTDPNAFVWLSGSALGDVAHECLGGHYEWALGVLTDAGIA
jgi:hypothetical protein